VLSPDSAASAVCQQELSIAVEQNKRVIPVLHRMVDPSALPPALARLNWIAFTDEDSRAEALVKLLDAIETDLEWRDSHTRLTVRTNEWLASGRDGSFLLRGRDLRAAEAWYATREGHREAPTAAQLDYLMASRRGASRRQRIVLGAVSLALSVAVVLGVLALVARNQAVHQANLAQSRQLATEASTAAATDVRLESLLGLEAFSRARTIQARSALVGAVEQPLIATMGPTVGTPPADIYGPAGSPHGPVVAAATKAGVELWTVATRRRVGTFDHSTQINGVAFSPDGRLLAVAETDDAVSVYHMPGRKLAYRLAGLGARPLASPSRHPVRRSRSGRTAAASSCGIRRPTPTADGTSAPATRSCRSSSTRRGRSSPWAAANCPLASSSRVWWSCTTSAAPPSRRSDSRSAARRRWRTSRSRQTG